KKLVEKLGYIAVFFFYIVLYGNKEYPGPYYEIEKGLFLLYHLFRWLMFLNMKLYHKMDDKDTIAIDGRYTLFVNQFVAGTIAVEKGYTYSDSNFVYPIRKNVNESLSITENHFNKTFGSFRSKIENQFSELGNKFYRFNNNKSVVRMDNIKFYNLQFKVACLLKNISIFVDKFNVPILPHHKLWESDGFEFPVEKKLLDIVVSNDKQNKDKLDKMLELQMNFLNMNVSENNMVIDEFSDEDSNNYKDISVKVKMSLNSMKGLKKEN
ncbi:hypothetical protein BDB00DRAFT_768312, partial [Zychaea mexicana]|uniref:uncharacterized protein n=1 Tax=Zychaea mexicana TaxID=64656 RepID=UPI0022FDC319